MAHHGREGLELEDMKEDLDRATQEIRDLRKKLAQIKEERDTAVQLLMTTEEMVIDETWFSRRDEFLLSLVHQRQG